MTTSEPPYHADLPSQSVAFFRTKVPRNVLASLDLYVTDRRPPGPFVRAVLENDLSRAVLSADPESREAIPAVVLYVHNCLPAGAWGSRERVRVWMEEGR